VILVRVADEPPTGPNVIVGQAQPNPYPKESFCSAEVDALYDCYLRGLYHLARYNLLDAEKAVGYFQSATELDPSAIALRAMRK
jgi:hypothetical protein